MLSTILIFLPLALVIIVPILVVQFASGREGTFPFKKTAKAKSEEERSGRGQWKAFGFLLMLGSLGSPLLRDFADVPLWIRAIIFLFGSALVYAVIREEKAAGRK